MQKLGDKIVKSYKKHIFDKAKDVKGKTFKQYSTNPTKWASILARKTERKKIPKGGISYGKAKKMGILTRANPKSREGTAPILSGDFKGDFQTLKVARNRLSVGWAAHGSKVGYLKDMGRLVTTSTQPLPKHILKMIDKALKKETEGQLPKENVKITLRK